jgi:hypothetical protein
LLRDTQQAVGIRSRQQSLLELAVLVQAGITGKVRLAPM